MKRKETRVLKINKAGDCWPYLKVTLGRPHEALTVSGAWDYPPDRHFQGVEWILEGKV